MSWVWTSELVTPGGSEMAQAGGLPTMYHNVTVLKRGFTNHPPPRLLCVRKPGWVVVSYLAQKVLNRENDIPKYGSSPPWYCRFLVSRRR